MVVVVVVVVVAMRTSNLKHPLIIMFSSLSLSLSLSLPLCLSVSEMDDPRWRLVHLYKKTEKEGITQYTVVGFITICLYYAFKESVRPRIR